MAPTAPATIAPVAPLTITTLAAPQATLLDVSVNRGARLRAERLEDAKGTRPSPL
jgi:hypothetical protein